MVSDYAIEAGKTHTYNLTITFLNKDEVQDDNQGVSFSTKVTINEATGVKKLITLTTNHHGTYYAEEGMTVQEWLTSKYNTYFTRYCHVNTDTVAYCDANYNYCVYTDISNYGDTVLTDGMTLSAGPSLNGC